MCLVLVWIQKTCILNPFQLLNDPNKRKTTKNKVQELNTVNAKNNKGTLIVMYRESGQLHFHHILFFQSFIFLLFKRKSLYWPLSQSQSQLLYIEVAEMTMANLKPTTYPNAVKMDKLFNPFYYSCFNFWVTMNNIWTWHKSLWYQSRYKSLCPGQIKNVYFILFQWCERVHSWNW